MPRNPSGIPLRVRKGILMWYARSGLVSVGRPADAEGLERDGEAGIEASRRGWRCDGLPCNAAGGRLEAAWTALESFRGCIRLAFVAFGYTVLRWAAAAFPGGFGAAVLGPFDPGDVHRRRVAFGWAHCRGRRTAADQSTSDPPVVNVRVRAGWPTLPLPQRRRGGRGSQPDRGSPARGAAYAG